MINRMTPWQRLVGLLKLEKKAVLQVLYYAIFTGLVSLSLPLGIQAIINLIQGAQITTSWTSNYQFNSRRANYHFVDRISDTCNSWRCFCWRFATYANAYY